MRRINYTCTRYLALTGNISGFVFPRLTKSLRDWTIRQYLPHAQWSYLRTPSPRWDIGSAWRDHGGSRDAYSSLQRDGKQYATLRFTRDHQLVLLLRPKSTKFVLVVRPISHKVHAVGDGCIKWIQGCVGCCWGCGNLSELKFGKIESSHWGELIYIFRPQTFNTKAPQKRVSKTTPMRVDRSLNSRENNWSKCQCLCLSQKCLNQNMFGMNQKL